MARTDLHRPSAIIPADYEFVACDYYGGGLEAAAFVEDRKLYWDHMARTGGKHAHIERDSGGCDVCGANCMYVARFYHRPSNSYIATGMDCAAKMEIDNPAAFKSFKQRVAAGLEAAAGKMKALRVLSEKGLVACWEIYAGMERGSWARDTIIDIVGKLVRYGSISDGQESFLRSLQGKVADEAGIAEQRAAEAAAAAPVPVTGERIKVEGVVLAIRTPREEDFYPVTKMLVQHASGWKVWGSRVGGAERGDTVEFFARITPSDKDPKFGFFSRPTKARVVSEAAAA